MSLLAYAKRELSLIGKDEDGLQDMINRQILDIVKTFQNQGHSGMSASYSIKILERLLRFKPIRPLTGEPDEWNDLSYLGEKQNIRCSSVFLKKDGTAEDIDGIVVSDNGGITWFSSGNFRKKVTFPYLPTIEPEKVYIEYLPSGGYEVITDDTERIRLLRERKEKEYEEWR